MLSAMVEHFTRSVNQQCCRHMASAATFAIHAFKGRYAPSTALPDRWTLNASTMVEWSR